MADLVVGSKLRRKLTSTLREDLSAPTSDFARRQLEKMGWTEGTGLGKRRDGIVTHVRVKKREDQQGLGTERAAVDRRAAGEQWWKDSLGDTLAKLGGKTKKKGSKKRKREYTDEELFEATGGARFGMRANPTTKLAKWRRAEGGDDDSNAEARDTGDAAPVEIEPVVEKSAKKQKKEKKSKSDKKSKKDKKKKAKNKD